MRKERQLKSTSPVSNSPHDRRPRRALKAWLQEAGLAPWERDGLPLVYCGDALAAVPGLGVDPDWAAGEGCDGLRVAWMPH